MQRISAKSLAAIKLAAGDGNWTNDPDILAPHLTEWRGKYQGQTPLMLLPRDSNHLQQIMRSAYENSIPVVPQGGNTGLVGGSLPGLDDKESLLISLKRMTKLLNDSPQSLVAEAGATIYEVQQAAGERDLYFPLSLASEASCTVGGTIATNAGGIHVIRYGTMRDLIWGVEAVLADGSIVSELDDLIKDNRGYRLSPLLAGSEGTLAIVTRARLKLFAPEREKITLWLDISTFEHAIKILSECKQLASGQLSVFELMSAEALAYASRHIPGCANVLNSRDEGADWSLLIEFGLSAEDPRLLEALSCLIEQQGYGILSSKIAQNLNQRNSFFHVREHLSEAQKKEGVSVKHDISLPLSKMADFVRHCTQTLQQRYNGIRPVVFGHLGDSNLHFNMMQPTEMDGKIFATHWKDIQDIVHQCVADFGGSISAEHGIGRMKKLDLKKYDTSDRLTAMRQIKRGLDPKGLLNPGVLLD